MELTLQTYLIVCPLVFFAGLVDAVAGGGGLISLPAYFIAGVPPHMSIGTNKLSSFIGTSVSTFRYYKNNFMDLSVAAASIACALVGSALGSNLSLLVPESVIQYLMIVILPIAAFYILKNKSFDQSENAQISRRRLYIAAMLISFFIGGYDGFYGPGTGTFLILLYTSLCKMDVVTASGNAKLVNLSSNLAALVVFIVNGKIVYPLGLVSALFCLAGHYIGAGLVLTKGMKVIKPVILFVLFLLFVKIVTGI